MLFRIELPMREFIPKTVGESLYWAYSNLAMLFASAEHGEAEYQQTDYIVRNKLFHGLMRGSMKVGSLLIDEKQKLSSVECNYCGAKGELTLDHLVPQLKGGPHAADNLVPACRSCNSSKQALDLLEWAENRDETPSPWLLRRYLKLAIRHCQENGLMDVPLPTPEGAPQRSLFDEQDGATLTALTSGKRPALPFAIWLLPQSFPSPGQYWGFKADEASIADDAVRRLREGLDGVFPISEYVSAEPE